MSAQANPVAAKFGANLRVLRARTGLSQEELGLRSSLHRTEIGLLERGTRVPRIDTLIKIASALMIPAEDLLEGIEWELERRKPSGQFRIAPAASKKSWLNEVDE